jgi:DNA repair protein RadA/Sms
MSSRSFVCLNAACREVHPHWVARCKKCLGWGVVELGAAAPAVKLAPVLAIAPPPLAVPVPPAVDPPADPPVVRDNVPIPLSEVKEETFVRDATGLAAVDAMLGGGLVVGSVVLLASPPGVGKTTLLLQVLAGLGLPTLYATGEETVTQVAERARRIGAASRKVYIVREHALEAVIDGAQAVRAHVIAVDSIQKMRSSEIDGAAGGKAQVAYCTDRLVEYAKSTNTAVWIIGQVTNDGGIAGPKSIEHAVDVVLDFDVTVGEERLLRFSTNKNRFGPTKEVARFNMTARGLVPVDGDGWDEDFAGGGEGVQ